MFFEHETGDHPECKERLGSILKSLEFSSLWDQIEHFGPDGRDVLPFIERVHTREYMQEVFRICSQGGGVLDTGDTWAGPRSYDAAVLAVSTTLHAVDKILDGELTSSFCALRPPGHHARPGQAMGFCIFNNAAIAARYLVESGKKKKVLVVDFDVHHGNGTQETFFEDESVFYLSSHQSPLFPGTGNPGEIGSGPGKGLTRNILLTRGDDDHVILERLQTELELICKSFEPDFLVLSAGFDAYTEDPIGGLKMSYEGFSNLTKMLTGIAAQYCQGKVLSVLEGGYHLGDLGELVTQHIQRLREAV